MIIVRVWEGLGNQMFQYAYARALELRTGQKVYLDISEYTPATWKKTIRKYGLQNFKIQLPVLKHGMKIIDFVEKHGLYRKKINEKSLFAVLPFNFCMIVGSSSYIKALTVLRGNYYLKGWFQNKKYFEEYLDVIRKEFYPKKKIRIPKELQHHIKDDNSVSIHIRRGDYKAFHQTISREYYEEAIQLIKEKVTNPYFIVFSDEIDWVKKNMNWGEDCYFVEADLGLQDYEELLVMSQCKHNIIANSTFSWWAAELNDNEGKIVIAPKKWCTWGKYRVNPGSILSSDWIKI